jgi:acetyltransferase-like isoleucine patch superfamily enzyme
VAYTLKEGVKMLTLKRLIANPLVRYYRDLLNSVKDNSIHKYARVLPGAILSKSRLDEYSSVGRDVELINSTLGRYSYVSYASRVANCDIGPFCSIGWHTIISPGFHPTDHVSTHPIFYSDQAQCATTWIEKSAQVENGRTIIGPDVWIGVNAVILDNVKIGVGAIIAASAVVTKDIEPYTVVGGVPAKPIRARFDEATKDKLIASEWWEMSAEWLHKNRGLFLGPPEHLLAAIDKEKTATRA